MKTKEELNALKEEVETLSKDLRKLSSEELTHISGGTTAIGRIAVIDRNQCGECGTCIDDCPVGAIGQDYEIGPECIGCGICEAACPFNCIRII